MLDENLDNALKRIQLGFIPIYPNIEISDTQENLSTVETELAKFKILAELAKKVQDIQIIEGREEYEKASIKLKYENANK